MNRDLGSGGQEEAKSGGFPDWVLTLRASLRTSIRRNPNQRSQEHRSGGKKAAAAAAAAADELQFFSRAFAEVLRFSPLLGNRTHTPARRHGSVSTGPLQTSRGERHAEGAMEEPGARGTGFLFSLNSEGPTRFPKRGGKEKAAC